MQHKMGLKSLKRFGVCDERSNIEFIYFGEKWDTHTHRAPYATKKPIKKSKVTTTATITTHKEFN